MLRSIIIFCALVIVLVESHGRLTQPVPRGTLAGKRVDLENAPVSSSTGSDFICRDDPAPPVNQYVAITAGQSVTIQYEITAAHPGDCFFYLSYSGDNVPMASKQWFKIWQQYDCKSYGSQSIQVPIPSYLPSCDHCILRFEWYALHQFPSIEFYSQCADVRITGSPNGGLPTPMVSIPGHLPPNGLNGGYRDPYNNPNDRRLTGPALATYNGQTVQQPSTQQQTSQQPSTQQQTSRQTSQQPTTRQTSQPQKTTEPFPSNTDIGCGNYQPGETFAYDCNSCVCSSNGIAAVCTNLDCSSAVQSVVSFLFVIGLVLLV